MTDPFNINFKDRNPVAYKFWNIILVFLIILAIGFGLILPFELLVGLAGVIVVLIYPALYFTLRP